MVIHKQFQARCRFCKENFDLFNYVGLHPDSRMGHHFCDAARDYMLDHPRAWKIHDRIKEVPIK